MKNAPNIRQIISFSILITVSIALFILNPFSGAKWVAFFIAGFVVFLIWAGKATKEFDRLPELNIKATITDKDEVERREESYINSNDASGGSTYTYRTYYQLTFKTENNIQWTFDVNLELFNSLMEGDSGNLIYKETKKGQIFFVRFIREN